MAVPLAADVLQKVLLYQPIMQIQKKKKWGGGASEGEGMGGKERGGRVACASSCSRSRAVLVTFHNFSKPMRRQKAPRVQLMFNVQLLVSFNKCDGEGGREGGDIGLQVIKG